MPNITQCWGACHYQGHLHILMEHCEGGDLLSVLGRQGTGFCEEVVACVVSGCNSAAAAPVTGHACPCCC